MPNIILDPVRSDQPNQDQKKISMEEQTKWLDDSVAFLMKFTQVVGGGVKNRTRMKTSHRVRKLMPLAHTVTADFAPGDTTLKCTNADAFIAGDVIYVPSVQKFMACKTDSTSGATSITVRKIDAASTGPDFAVSAMSIVLNLMESHAEGAAIPTARTIKTETIDTYIYQTDEKVGVTDIEANEENYGNEKSLEEARKGQALARMRAMEMMMITGLNLREQNSASGRRHLPAGLEYHLYSNAVDASALVGGLTMTSLGNIIRTTKDHSASADEKLFMYGSAMASVMSGWGGDKVRISPGEDQSWGVTFNRLITPFGNLKCKYNPLLTPENGMDDRAFILDPEQLLLIQLKGLPLEVRYNVNNATDVHNILDLFTGTRGFEMYHPDELHREIIGIKGA